MSTILIGHGRTVAELEDVVSQPSTAQTPPYGARAYSEVCTVALQFFFITQEKIHNRGKENIRILEECNALLARYTQCIRQPSLALCKIMRVNR